MTLEKIGVGVCGLPTMTRDWRMTLSPSSTATEKSATLTSIRRSPMSRGSQRHISMLARIAARSRADAPTANVALAEAV